MTGTMDLHIHTRKGLTRQYLLKVKQRQKQRLEWKADRKR